jgi:hypothetical protein
MENDLNLISQTMHKWKVDLLLAEQKDLKKNFPGITIYDERWATCMVLSRALMAQDLNGERQPALIPFMDLLNHGTSATQDYTAGATAVKSKEKYHGSLLVKAGPAGIKKGEEITMMYSASPSKARMLTSFGFWEAIPAATLLTGELPKFDTQDHSSESHPAYGKNGCPRQIKTFSISMDEKTYIPTIETLAKDVRCLRLHLYSNAEAKLALSQGFPSLGQASWIEPNIPAKDMLSMMKKDQSIVGNTGHQCATANTDAMLQDQMHLLEMAAPDMQHAVRQESIALMKCGEIFRETVAQLQVRIAAFA